MIITRVTHEDLEKIARRVWYGHWETSGKKDACGQKRSQFEKMGYPTNSTALPYGMHQYDWVNVGKLDISYTHGKWDIPGYFIVRKAVVEDAII